MAQKINVKIVISTEGEPCEMSTQEIADYWEGVVKAALGPVGLGTREPSFLVDVRKEDI